MNRDHSRQPRRPARGALRAAVLGALALVACDTGDGTRLQAPTAPTTLPPVDTTPLPSTPIEPVPIPTAPPLDTEQLEAGSIAATASEFQLFVPWAPGAQIDQAYTCTGNNAAPAISWSGLPAGTVEVAVAMVDETNLSNGRPFIHWVVGGIDPSIDRLGENEVPLGALQSINFFGEIGYTGPCPDLGNTNTYRVTVYALAQQLEIPDGTPSGEMLDLIGTVALATASTPGIATR